MLTKHYAEASGFEVVFFLPDCEDDFASYTEFLRYLGAKDRAGVAKFDDGTTLFLVPPSDFLKNVLKVVGPERLYGVVLKFAFQPPGNDLIHQQPVATVPSSQYSDRQAIRQQSDFSQISQKEEPLLSVEYNRVLHEDLKHSSKPYIPQPTQSSSMQSAPPEYSSSSVSLPQAGVTLTPELIASLASLVPTNPRTSALENPQPILGSSNSRPSYPASVPSDKGTTYGWKHDQSAMQTSGQLVQPFGSQFNPAVQSPQVQPFASLSGTSSHSVSVAPGSTQAQDFSAILPQQGSNVTRLPPNFAITSQSGQFAASATVGQQYHQEAPLSNMKGYGMAQGADAPLYNMPAFADPSNSIPSSAQGHAATFLQPQSQLQAQPQPNLQSAAPIAAERVNSELNNQMNHIQSAFAGAGQGSSDVETDKNQRYQSTLQFAANLLLQIQQQQTNATGGQGSGN